MTDCLIAEDLKDEVLNLTIHFSGGASPINFTGKFSEIPLNAVTKIDWSYKGHVEHWTPELCGVAGTTTSPLARPTTTLPEATTTSIPPTTATTAPTSTTAPTITVTEPPSSTAPDLLLTVATTPYPADQLPFTGPAYVGGLVTIAFLCLGVGFLCKSYAMNWKAKRKGR